VTHKTSLKNGESLDLIVSVTGKGNMKLFSLPKPVVPNALEMYDPVHTEKLNTSCRERLEKLQTVILYTAVQKLPCKTMQFSYFDLNLGKIKP
jgi:hypothetical protein